jgi:hypothetical protein
MQWTAQAISTPWTDEAITRPGHGQHSLWPASSFPAQPMCIPAYGNRDHGQTSSWPSQPMYRPAHSSSAHCRNNQWPAPPMASPNHGYPSGAQSMASLAHGQHNPRSVQPIPAQVTVIPTRGQAEHCQPSTCPTPPMAGLAHDQPSALTEQPMESPDRGQTKT